MSFTPNEGRKAKGAPGVSRFFCPECGSPVAGRYAYLPGQVYVGLGLLDQAAELVPHLHAHEAERLPWLHIDDDLERIAATSRAELNKAGSSGR